MNATKLFELVHKLSKAERRAFKLSGAYKKDQSLLYLLFDHICSLKEENHHLLTTKIKNERLLKKLPRIKRDLYSKLLDFLANYYEDNLIDAKIYKQIRVATILIEKQLYQQAWEQIIKAKKQAQLYEKYNHLLDALVVQTRIINKTESPKNQIVKRDEFNLEINDALAKQQWLFKQEQLISRLWTTYNNDGAIKESQQREAYQKELNELPPLPFKGYRFSKQYELIRSLYFNLLGDTQNAYSCKKQLAEISTQYPHFTKIYIDEHIITLLNLVFAGIRNKLYQETLIHLKELESFLKSCSSALQERYLPYTWDARLACLNGIKAYDKSWVLVIKIEANLSQYQAITEGAFLNIISNNIISTCFFVQNYSHALDWINRILNKSNKTLRQDYYINIRFLECFALIENDLGYLVESKLRTLKTFLKKNNKLFTLERWLLSFIHQLISNDYNRKKRKELYKAALEELEAHQSNPLFHIFDYSKWIETLLTP